MQVILHTPAEIPFKGATVAKGTNYGSKEIELKHSNITNVLSRGEYFESQKITNTTQLTDHMPPLPRHSLFPTRTIPSKKKKSVYSSPLSIICKSFETKKQIPPADSIQNIFLKLFIFL